MARYTGPVCRLCRREQTKLFLKGEKCFTKCVLENRPAPPGVAKPQRGKPSEYAIRLREKQKLRRMIAMTETPFRRQMQIAARTPAKTSEVFLQALETRLDNIVRRLGIATSLNTARQLVLHGHIRVDGKAVNVPSARVRVGQVVSLAPGMKDNVGVKLSLELAQRKTNRPSYLEFDDAQLSGKMLRDPSREEAQFPVSDQLIVEYYSR